MVLMQIDEDYIVPLDEVSIYFLFPVSDSS